MIDIHISKSMVTLLLLQIQLFLCLFDDCIVNIISEACKLYMFLNILQTEMLETMQDSVYYILRYKGAVLL
jgi:hypothetical protein